MNTLSIKLTTGIFALLALLLSGCSTHKMVKDDNWPADMPEKSVFIAAYQSDPANQAIQAEEEYMLWIVRFYKGWELYRRGWIKMTNELMSQLPNPDEAEEVEARIYRIGVKMSSEWAKKSDQRTIYLRHVYVWGNALLESIDRNNCLELVTQVENDIDALLARKLNKEAIALERYHPVDEDNPFL